MWPVTNTFVMVSDRERKSRLAIKSDDDSVIAVVRWR
jgi:hypothetical protein